jgi:hypothetical protein
MRLSVYANTILFKLRGAFAKQECIEWVFGRTDEPMAADAQMARTRRLCKQTGTKYPLSVPVVNNFVCDATYFVMGDGEEEYNADGQDNGIKEQGCHRSPFH